MIRHITTAGLAVLAAAGASSIGLEGPPPETTTLAAFVDSIRVADKLPALVLVIVHADGAPQIIVSGERRYGHHDPILPTDRMHIGSNGKAITAT